MKYTTIKHFVEFLHPGMVISDTSHQEIDARDDSLVKISSMSFAYRFFSVKQFIEPSTGEILTGSPFNYSPWRYYGIAMTLDDVKRKVKDNKILVANMINNKIEKVVKTKFGQYIPLLHNDIVIGGIK